MKKIISRTWTWLGARRLLKFIPDKTYIKIAYYLNNHIKLNLDEPRSFNEKLNWLKLNYRDDSYYKIVDKASFKDYVDNKIGGGYTIKTYKVYNSVKEINFDELPTSFAIKCTHDSHSVFIVKDKGTANKKQIIKGLKKHLKRNLYDFAKEWPYKKAKARIIVEELLNKDSKDSFLVDYKWFCFDGKPKVMYIGKDAGNNPSSMFFDMNYNKIDMKGVDPIMDEIPERPIHFDRMKELASILSKGMPHVRVDFYIDSNNKLYVGEMTFFHSAGLGRFTPESAEQMMGDFIDLEKIKQ